MVSDAEEDGPDVGLDCDMDIVFQDAPMQENGSVAGPNRILAIFSTMRPFTLLLPGVAALVGAIMGFHSLNPTEPFPYLYLSSEHPFLRRHDGFQTTLEGIAAILLVFAGSNMLNAVYDARLDKIKNPLRPIPSGLLTENDAYTVAWLFYLWALFRSIFVSTMFSYILLLLIILTVLYSIPPVRLKKRFLISNISIGLTQGLLSFVAAWSIFGNVTEYLPWIIGGVIAMYITGASATKDFVDIQGDRQFKIKTLPAVFGRRRALYVISPFFIFPFLLIILYTEWGFLKFETHYLLPLAAWALAIPVMLIWEHKKRSEHIHNIAWLNSCLLGAALFVGFGVVYLYM